MRYFIHLAYDGSKYCGWQVQPNGDTVQHQLNFALSRLLNRHVSSMGCGRTDAGVHATDFYAHFTTAAALDERFQYKLNAVLPNDINIYHVFQVADNAHTRFDATEREYQYFFHFEKNPFLRQYSFHIQYKNIDWDKIYEATALLPSFEDFTSLCRPSEDFKTNICAVKYAQWEKINLPFSVGHNYTPNPQLPLSFSEGMKFTIASNRFLRGMVRKIVGTMLAIGQGKLSVADFQSVVMAKEDFKKVFFAPPQGLYLTKVKYPYL